MFSWGNKGQQRQHHESSQIIEKENGRGSEFTHRLEVSKGTMRASNRPKSSNSNAPFLSFLVIGYRGLSKHCIQWEYISRLFESPTSMGWLLKYPYLRRSIMSLLLWLDWRHPTQENAQTSQGEIYLIYRECWTLRRRKLIVTPSPRSQEKKSSTQIHGSYGSWIHRKSKNRTAQPCHSRCLHGHRIAWHEESTVDSQSE